MRSRIGAVNRGGDKPHRIKARALFRPQQIQHCDNYEWRTVIQPDSTGAGGHSRPMRKLCLVVPNGC